MKSPIQSAIVFGANSAIATSFCRLIARQGARIHLIGRDQDALENLASDLEIRGAKRATIAVADLDDTEKHEQLVEDAWNNLEKPDLALLAFGSLGSQEACQNNWQQQRTQIQTNLISQMSLLTLLSNKFELQRSGCLAAISSVAADRGRASNYIYGSAKAGLSAYLQGLHSRLAAANVRVVDLRPGPVDTPMTAGLSKGLLWSDPESIANSVHRALARRNGTIYLPFYWRPIMLLIKILPERFIRKL